MAQDPYSALATGLQQGMNMGAMYQQFQDREEQKKIDNAMTGMKLHMALLDPSMPKAANKVGMEGLIKIMADPSVSKAFNLSMPEGFDPAHILDNPSSSADIYKQAGPIFKKIQSGEIDKTTGMTLLGGIANDLAYSRSQEKTIMETLKKDLEEAYGKSPDARMQKVQDVLDEKGALVDAGYAETPAQARAAGTSEAVARQQALVNAGLAETPGAARAAGISADLVKHRALVNAGYAETPGQARAASEAKRNYMTPEAASKRITEINVGRANFGKSDNFTSAILVSNPALAGAFKEGEKIPDNIKANVMAAYDAEEALLRKHIPTPTPEIPMGVAHGRVSTAPAATLPAPAATLPAPAAGGVSKKVVRTGTDAQGNKVAQFDDGTIGPMP